jgi:hypothetical protein
MYCEVMAKLDVSWGDKCEFRWSDSHIFSSWLYYDSSLGFVEDSTRSQNHDGKGCLMIGEARRDPREVASLVQ